MREVRIISDEPSGESMVLLTADALRLAQERGLDLVEVAPNQSPPVCKFLDYGRFKFVQAKKAKEARKAQTRNVQREVRLRPRIGEHDLQSKVRSVRSLLEEGAKVKVTVMLRGREHTHPDIALKVLRRVAEAVATAARLERPPSMDRRSLSIVLAPAAGQSVGATSGNSAANAQDQDS